MITLLLNFLPVQVYKNVFVYKILFVEPTRRSHSRLDLKYCVQGDNIRCLPNHNDTPRHHRCTWLWRHKLIWRQLYWGYLRSVIVDLCVVYLDKPYQTSSRQVWPSVLVPCYKVRIQCLVHQWWNIILVASKHS